MCHALFLQQGRWRSVGLRFFVFKISGWWGWLWHNELISICCLRTGAGGGRSEQMWFFAPINTIIMVFYEISSSKEQLIVINWLRNNPPKV